MKINDKITPVSSLKIAIKRIIKRSGLYALYLGLMQINQLTLTYWLKLKYYQFNYLKKIRLAKPIDVSSGTAEIHMLLNHKRIYEGLWALYSLVFFYDECIKITIHDDGTLKLKDKRYLEKIFPGIRLITRGESDAHFKELFHSQHLEYCKKLRDTLVFGIKLFDPCVFSTSEHLILMDSDVLFYKKPVALLKNVKSMGKTNLYSEDNQYVYCISEEDAQELLGKPIIHRFNPGLVKLSKGMVDFQQIEQYLQHPGFWTPLGNAGYFAELTLWALELSRYDSHPFPKDYAICAPNPAEFTFGHYCGGGYWSSLFYTKGIPYVASKIFVKS